ncbi:DUF2583 family protein [Klebsiella pneumoniae subsp. pneumoniae]|nr:DUF2583 family protein [Klebsiella pneumoniae subsp. pneumoniae]
MWGVGYSILNQLPQLTCHNSLRWRNPKHLRWRSALLAGARIGGHEQVSDRYWWVRHYDKRCRRNQHRHS